MKTAGPGKGAKPQEHAKYNRVHKATTCLTR